MNHRRKTKGLYSLRCLYLAASFFDELAQNIYTELGLKALFLNHLLHYRQIFSVQFPLVPCGIRDMFITKGRGKEGRKKTSHCPHLNLRPIALL